MKSPSRALVVLLVVLMLPSLTHAGPAGSRHKPGPVTLRGIALHVRSGSFTLETRTHGSFAVSLSGATQITQKGKRGQVTLHEGDHVGVHGFVHGRQIRAITVRIYPVKPKPYDIRGTVVAIKGSRVSLQVSGKTVVVTLTSSTAIHLGSRSGTVADLKVGNRVQVRVEQRGSALLALSVHIYHSRTPARHLEIQGTVTSVTAGAIVVRSGSSSYQIRLTSGTAVYLGSSRTSTRALKSGQTVTVHACCAGQPLVATSIHIRKTRVSHPTLLLRGWVTSLSRTSVRLETPSGAVTITLQASTVYELGSGRMGWSGLRLGDEVSIRAYRSGSSLVAERVHVYVSSREPHSIDGTVASVSPSGLVVVSRGKRYTVTVARSTAISLNGKGSGLGSIRAGDRVRVQGRLTGPESLAATSVVARRAIPKARAEMVRGTLAWLAGSTLVIVDGFGTRHTVRLAAGARIRLHGKPAPAAALFPGVSMTARGHVDGNVLLATTVTVRSRTVEGRVIKASSHTIKLRLSTGSDASIDLPPGVSVADGNRRLQPSTVRPGAYLRASGYLEPSGAVRAASVHLLHPSVDTAARVMANGSAMVVQTSRGERYTLHFSSSTEISTGRAGLALKRRDIPTGARVHVWGTMRSDGTLGVTQLAVRLASATVRGSITSVEGNSLTVESGGTAIQAQVEPTTTFAQGSHTLSLSDVVVGDDVTVYGYQGASGIVFARRVLVHRKLVGLDGSVAAATADGFTMSTSTGTVTVILSPATVFSNGAASDLVPGATVHVTGYRRGDGVILATRVRLGKKR